MPGGHTVLLSLCVGPNCPFSIISLFLSEIHHRGSPFSRKNATNKMQANNGLSLRIHTDSSSPILIVDASGCYSESALPNGKRIARSHLQIVSVES